MSGTVHTPQGSDDSSNASGPGPSILVAEPAQENQALSPISDDQIQQLIASTKAENRRLEMNQELAELQARNTALRNSTSSATVTGATPSWGGLSAIVDATPKVKTLRPEKMRPYKGQSEGEHLRWFLEVAIQFMNSPEYFTTDQAKIGFCMKSLEDDPSVQWYREFETHGLDGVTFDSFKRFLLDLVADPVNRRLAAYEKWEAARQRDMKVSAFKAHLEELEGHLPPFEEEHRANFFLAKLRSELKNKILSTGNVPKLREEILAMAIMQENILDRSRAGGGSNNQSSSKNSSGSKKRKSQDDPNSDSKPPRGDGDATARASGSGTKRNVHTHDDRSNDVCVHCGKKGHWKPDCPDRDKPQTYVAAMAPQSKNDQAPPTPLKRSKPNSESKSTNPS